MRIVITGFFGWGNSGDEGILQAMIDSFGMENEIIVSTSLPYTMLEDYRYRLGYAAEVRHLYDTRVDFDIWLLGGGGLNFGYGWQQALSAIANEKPCMTYGIGFRTDFYKTKLKSLMYEFLKHFKAITVRDESTFQLMENVGLNPILTMCPAINLKEQKTECPENMVAVCPRYEDSDKLGKPGNNKPQIEWIVKRLEELGEEAILIPFAAKDREGNLRDLELCREIAKRIKGSRIFMNSGFEPKKIKYAISKSKHVISGGRYHALVWAAAHQISYEIAPTAPEGKLQAFVNLHKKYGNKLLEMEKANLQMFRRVLSG